MEKKSDVILIIPSYNEAGNIERVVDELISGYPRFDYVVVTDGPTDGTDEICRRRGYNTLFLPENMGLTRCFRNGMKYAWEQGYTYAVQFDGDGQHRPEYIEAMVQKAREGYDLVQGSRFLPLPENLNSAERASAEASPAEKAAAPYAASADKAFAPGDAPADSNGSVNHVSAHSTALADDAPAAAPQSSMGGMRALGSVILRIAIKLKTGKKVTDPTCGLRLYSRALIDDFANKSSYAPEPDTVAKLLKKGVRYTEVPVRVAERESGESYLNPVKAVKYMARMLRSILGK